MALNLGKKKDDEEQEKETRNIVLGESREERERVKLQSMDQYQRARMELQSDFIQDVTDAAEDNVASEEELMAAEKRYKQLRTKRNVLFGAIVTFLAVTTLLGVYKTFFSHQMTPQEVAYYANYYNGKTNFPMEGVQGFLQTNVPSAMIEDLTASKNVGEIIIKDLEVSLVWPKSDTVANVYFYMTVGTNSGETRVNCQTCVGWDANGWKYTLLDPVNITPMRSVDRDPNIGENPYSSFDGISDVSEELNLSAQTFVDNMLDLFYEGKDISPYYTGPEMNVGNLQYNGMSDFKLYSQANGDGYNAVAEISLALQGTDLSYTTNKYFNIQQKDGGWVISRMM